MNFKNLLLGLLAVLMFSCQEDGFQTFDHKAQYKKEKVVLEDYLKSHYYNSTTHSFDDLVEGETPLFTDAKLKVIDTVSTDVNVRYDLYVYITKEGTQVDEKDEPVYPDDDDTVNIHYDLYDLDGVFLDQSNDNDSFSSLTGLIEGWQIGLTHFRGGEFDEATDDQPRVYSNGGQGFMLIPSGLAYRNSSSGAVLPNTPLLFRIDLRYTGKN